MTHIVLISPGATEYAEQGRIQGTLDMPLSEAGADEVARVVKELAGRQIEVVYHSSSEPATQTAEAVAAALGAKTRKLDNMRNLDHGLWQGMLRDDIRRKQPKVYRRWQEEPENMRPPEGETLAEAQGRAQASVKKLLKKHKAGTIALVVPQPLASIVRAELCRGDLGDLWLAETAHGIWEIIDVEPASATPIG